MKKAIDLIPFALRSELGRIPFLGSLAKNVFYRIAPREQFNHRISSGPAAGLKFPITLPEDRFYWAGTYEREFCQAIIQMVEPGSICFDVGAHRGYISGVLAIKSRAAVFSFEPFIENQKAIHLLRKLNPELDIRLQSFALGDFDGFTSFKVHSDSSMGKIEASEFQKSAEITSELDIAIRKMDSIVFGNLAPPPSIIKIDVEGSEANVLRGSLATLEKYHPTVVLEVHSEEIEIDCREIFKKIGYAITELSALGEYPRHLIGKLGVIND